MIISFISIYWYINIYPPSLESISKASSQLLVTPTRQTINPMALKLFPHTICGVTER